jgi:tetratricopeptide (TPR) repeat protein/tRNA A-37 threonylcarbamoyl transferase component Bud32
MSDDKDDDIQKRVLAQLKELSKLDTQSLGDDEIPQFGQLFEELDAAEDVTVGMDFGHWRVVKPISRGGMSCVYLVERSDGQVQQQAALKVIPHGLLSDQVINRFLRERQILTDLNHVNIAQLYDAGVTDKGIPWFVMEYIEGEDIITYASRHNLNLEQRVVLFKQVCEALIYAHSKGVVHRDIKPNNLIVGQDKVVKLLDFGIAANAEDESLTMTGSVVGTPGYLSPEQAKGLTHEIDRRSDIFSMGVLLYKLLKGDLPFQADNISEISRLIIHEEPTLMGHQIPVELHAITFKCLEKKVEDRYSSAKKLLQDLDAYLNGDVVSARKVTAWVRFTKKVKKHPIVSNILMVAVLVGFLGIAYGIYQSVEAFKRVQLTKEYMQVVQDMKGRIERAHLLPLHNVQDVYDQISVEIEQLRTAIEQNDVDDSGFSEFALGMAYENMRNYKKALDYYQQAEAKGWQSPELYSGLGMALTVDWNQRKLKAKAIKAQSERDTFIAKARQESYLPSLKYLEKAQKESNTANFLAAHLAYTQEKYDEAIEYALAEFEQNPWHYDALRLASEIYLFKFKIIGQEQGYDVSMKYLDLSNEALEQSINIGRSDPYNYTSRCTNASIDIQVKRMFKLDDQVKSAFDKGVEYCEAALALKPDAHSPWASLNILYTNRAAHLESQNQSAIDTYQQALEMANKGLAIYPDDNNLMGYKIKPLIKLAEQAIINNNSPIEYYNQALTTVQKALAINPDNGYVWSQLAELQLKQGDYYLEVKGNQKLALTNYQKSKQAYMKNHELSESLEALSNWAEVEYKVAQIYRDQGLLVEAVKAFESVIDKKKQALPLRKIYVDSLIATSKIQDELIALKIQQNQNTDDLVRDYLKFIQSVCQIDGITAIQKQSLLQFAQEYLENSDFNADNHMPCKVN